MKVAILTDTNSGISKKEAENIGIYVIPMPVLIDGEVFYEALTSGKNVTTSQPSPADVIDTWEMLFEDGYDEIVYIPMSSGSRV